MWHLRLRNDGGVGLLSVPSIFVAGQQAGDPTAGCTASHHSLALETLMDAGALDDRVSLLGNTLTKTIKTATPGTTLIGAAKTTAAMPIPLCAKPVKPTGARKGLHGRGSRREHTQRRRQSGLCCVAVYHHGHANHADSAKRFSVRE